MDDSRLVNVTQLKGFLKGSQKLVVSLEEATIAERYSFIRKTLKQFSYWSLVKKDKRVVVNYLRKVTDYKLTQLFRLIKRAGRGNLTRGLYHKVHPVKIYTSADIKLLEKTDELHLRLSEKATKEILRRAYEVFHHQTYQTIAKISHAHVSNLRHSPSYRSFWINHTKARQVPIGQTCPPQNFGRPGSIRIDSVSQKDVYHINSVDEITQWEIVFCVPQLSELFMVSALEEIFSQYPFSIFNFHSDRGKETINYVVADLLHRLLIKQTKSRSYHSGDNALVETKNGVVIRKNMGWEHINQDLTDEVNCYYKNFFNPYLNFHRPCAYPTITTNTNGKKEKVYEIYKTPYEALKDLSGAEDFLKPGISFNKLDTIAYQHSDNKFAEMLRKEEDKLFTEIRQRDKKDGLA
ncbi:integrase [Candidatus Daviesbacteria bacterium]|nr:integrase [Candidatus Daviesbacteria bacterium]